MKEVDFYQEIAELVSDWLQVHLPPQMTIAYTHNQRTTKNLRAMVRDLEEQLGIGASDEYLPELAIDALIGVCSPEGNVTYVVLEIKYQKAVSLMEFSQLVGYLQMGRHAHTGLLISVVPPEASAISSSFKREISGGVLPMSWSITPHNGDEAIDFKAGIVTYPIGGQARFIDAASCGGVSSPEELSKVLLARL